MAGNVIRQDIIEVGFDIDLKELTQVNKEIDDMKKGIAGGIGDDAFDGLTDSAKQAQKGADALQGDLKNVSKVSMAKLNLGLDNIEDKLTSIAKKAGTAAYKALKKVAGISFKALSIGIAGAATATAALVGSAVSAYADYEQLIGGVETLFKDSSGTVEKYANDAYKTAGLSANAYMETVTSFSASLLQSVGGDTAKAAEYANRAIVDMSDNANKMGTSMESIQYAYQGFAKQNYTMLDNLKLGYGGTKEEMKRLLTDAEKISGQKFDLSSYADIVQAIHVIQENMGVAGTTAKEASDTISGSLSSMKSAWQNLLPSLLKGGDSFNQCVDNLVSSVKKFAKNIKPAIKKALGGVTELIKELVPIIAEELPAVIIELAPVLANAGAQIVVGLAKGVANNAGKLITAAKEVIVSVIKAIYEAITGQPMGEEKFNELKRTVDDVFSAIGKILSAVMQVLKALAPVLLFVLDIAVKVFTWIGDNAEWLTPIILTLVGAFLLYKGVMGAISVAQRIMAVSSALLSGVLPAVSAGTTAAGTAAGASAVPIDTAAKAFMKFGVGVLAAGAGVMFIAAGFWLLAQAAIALANAGWGAIAVFALLVVAVIALAQVVVTCGTAMIAGSVGFLIFGEAVLLVGAGFALLGAGALLSAYALQIIAGILPALVQYGLSGTVAILALGAGLAVFAAGALLAGVAIGVLAAAMLLAVVSMAALLVVFVVLAPLALLFSAAMVAVAPAFTKLKTAAPALAKSLKSLPKLFTKLIAPAGLLVAAISPLAKKFSSCATSSALFLVALLGIVGAFSKLTLIIKNAVIALQQFEKAFARLAQAGGAKMLNSIVVTLRKMEFAIRQTNLSNAGAQMMNGLIRGMNSRRNAAISAARAIAQAINREYRKIQDIHSPSGEWEKYGAYQIQGNINGMKNSVPELERTVDKVGEASMPYAGHYTPENSTTYTSSRRAEYNTYSPQFSFSISGTNDDRAITRKVKRAVADAWSELMSDYEMKIPQTQEV